MYSKKEQEIIETLKNKAKLKQNVFTNTYEIFKNLKILLKDIEVRYIDLLKDTFSENKSDSKDIFSENIIKYKNLSNYQAELKVAGDILVFQMHSNVFEFDRDHDVWKTAYVQKNKMSTFSGIINIYNFLSDSFRYNRFEDLGYLVGRIFINKDYHFFVEGKRQNKFLYNDFGKNIISDENLKHFVETAIAYSMEFNLLAPLYDAVKVITVEQIQDSRAKHIKTGKRLGFGYHSDDVSGEKLIYTGG